MRINWLIAAVLILLAAGCQSQSHQTLPHEAALQQWNAARASALYGVARDQYSNGNFDKSRQTALEALRLNPTYEPLHVLSAKLAIEQSQLELADRELKLARDLDPKDAEAEYLAGVVYQRWQKFQTALEFYCRAAQKNPAEPAYVLAQAEMLVSLNRPAEALALALLQDQTAHFEHSGVIRDAIGKLLVDRGRYDQAVATLREASVLSNDDPTIREHLALALFYDKQYESSAAELARLVREDGYTRRADLFLALGECQMQLKHPREARAAFETASDLNPSSASVWLSLAKSAITLGDLTRADLVLRKAAALDPTSSDAQLMLGYVRLRQNRLEEALGAFAARDLCGGDSVSLCMMGYVMNKMGHADQALSYYAQALRLDPQDELAGRLMAEARGKP